MNIGESSRLLAILGLGEILVRMVLITSELLCVLDRMLSSSGRDATGCVNVPLF